MIVENLIEKEQISNLYYPESEVLGNKIAMEKRAMQLQKASRLGNLNKFKVHIHFEDSTGIKTIYTTIWAVTEKNIILKAGRIIPRKRIHAVQFV